MLEAKGLLPQRMPADCPAANAAREHAMRGVLSSSGTRLAPTEAARRPVVCCFEHLERR